MKQTYLKTLHDSDIGERGVKEEPKEYQHRETVRAIVINEKGQIGLVTNDVHHLYTLSGGGADNDDLEKEIIRECEEEIHQRVEVMEIIGKTKEFRNRDAKEYTTTCFLVKAVGEVGNDTRTEDERNNGLRVEWIEKEKVKDIFQDQNKRIDEGKVDFYNTAFNIRRDTEFLKEYFKNNS